METALVGLSSPSDLAVVANGARMKGKERVALDIGWNGRGRRCMHLHHLFMLLEDDPNDVVDEIVGQLCVRDSAIVKADRLIGPKEGGIGPVGSTGAAQPGQYKPQRCNVLWGERDEANPVLGF